VAGFRENQQSQSSPVFAILKIIFLKFESNCKKILKISVTQKYHKTSNLAQPKNDGRKERKSIDWIYSAFVHWKIGG
jgi:hypothetical protein